MSILKMRDLTSKAEVLETYAELFDVFDDNKEICKELCKVYDKIRGLPILDAVPVTRCRDCKHRKAKAGDCYGNVLVLCNDGVWRDMEFFCADGERNEE